MKLARYFSSGIVKIVEEPTPLCPDGGLLIRTEASGLCSGELMNWYMDSKVPHVLGHEVTGVVVESQNKQFPVGSRVVPHHHAPCLKCDLCQQQQFVHCPTWKKTHLIPGGMAEFFAIPKENLADCQLANNVDPCDAALTEPLACVLKSISQAKINPNSSGKIAVIGLGSMGILHLFTLRAKFKSYEVIGYEMNESRIAHAKRLGMNAEDPSKATESNIVFVCPGTQSALDLATKIVACGGTIVLFAPFPPDSVVQLPINDFYFRDITVTTSYSAGPPEMKEALFMLKNCGIHAETAVSHFIRLDELPEAYQAMKEGRMLKAMVQFPPDPQITVTT